MLTNSEIVLIKEKMKRTHTYSATFAREIGVSRQAVNGVLNRKHASAKIERLLKIWLHKKENQNKIFEDII